MGNWYLSLDVWQRSFMHGKAIHENGGHWEVEFTDYDSSSCLGKAFTRYKGGKHISEVVADAAIDFPSIY